MPRARGRRPDREEPPDAEPAPPTDVLIVFGSTEGHTARLVRHLAARLTAAGRSTTVRSALELRRRAIEPGAYPVVFVAASLHWARYQNSITEFALRHHAALNATDAAFISCSLSAAGVKQPEAVTLEDCLATFARETGWTPRAVHHAAGGIRHSAYDYFKALAAHLIAESRGEPLGLTQDYDLTDYEAAARFALDFAAARLRLSPIKP